MARLVCKQALCHTAVSIVQISVWCLNIHQMPVHYATLRHIRDASGARRLINGSGANKHSRHHGTRQRECLLVPRRHSGRLRCSVVDCITLRYIVLLDI